VRDLYERRVELEDGTPPTERITEYVSALLKRFPPPGASLREPGSTVDAQGRA
jgi:hypothetical protein